MALNRQKGERKQKTTAFNSFIQMVSYSARGYKRWLGVFVVLGEI